MNQPIQVMLVEDNAEYRDVVSMALEEEPDLRMSAQFGTAEAALRCLLDNAPGTTIPDVILLDIRLPGMDGLDALSRFREEAPNTKIVMLTQSDGKEEVLLAISRGASGYLLKSSTANQITDGIRIVMKGGASLDANVAKMVLESLQKRLPEDDIRDAPLTDRELEVLTLLSEGLVKKEIAERLGIGYTTVDTHVGHIYEKLQVKNAPSAVNRAHRLGLFFRGKGK